MVTGRDAGEHRRKLKRGKLSIFAHVFEKNPIIIPSPGKFTESRDTFAKAWARLGGTQIAFHKGSGMEYKL